MKKALKELKKKISRVQKPKNVNDKTWSEFLDNSTVVLMAGGESSRFSEITKGASINKNAFTLPNGETMIEMAIKMYRDAGFRNFVASVFHNATSIEEVLGDGSRLEVSIKYSYDPEKPVGKGGAIKNAIINGSIPESHYCIIHNPDDVIIGFEKKFPKYIVSGHIQGSKAFATVVVVESTPYTYSGMKIINNIVHQIEMYPEIPIPTHIGVTVLSPQSYQFFKKHFDLNKKADFESVLLPIFAKKRLLKAVSIPKDCWIPVNNAKNYKELLRRLEKN